MMCLEIFIKSVYTKNWLRYHKFNLGWYVTVTDCCYKYNYIDKTICNFIINSCPGYTELSKISFFCTHELK